MKRILMTTALLSLAACASVQPTSQITCSQGQDMISRDHIDCDRSDEFERDRVVDTHQPDPVEPEEEEEEDGGYVDDGPSDDEEDDI